jgi:hypothetical protein
MSHLRLFLLLILVGLFSIVTNTTGRKLEKLVVREKIDRIGRLQSGGAGESER